jgi:VanZ family protein
LKNVKVLVFRTLLAIYFVALAIALLGPFQGAEQGLGLSDKSAHALAFYILTVLILYSLPRLRKYEVAAIALGIGIGIELIQTFTGRQGSYEDALANGLGTVMAVIPLYVMDIRRGGEMPERRKGFALPFGRKSDLG